MEPNTNLQYPRTDLPMLLATLPAGDHELICAVYADTEKRKPESAPKMPVF
jgi:hypothetical protein